MKFSTKLKSFSHFVLGLSFLKLILILISTSHPALATNNSRQASSVTCEAQEAINAFQAMNKKVVTFVGYSSDYEDPAQMLAQAKEILTKLNPQEYIVNIGATPMGIGQIYALAQELGFTTTGIVSQLGKPYQDTIRNVDHTFFIKDTQWGGYLPNGKLSPTSEAMVEVSDIVIGIGGGPVVHDELLEASNRDKVVRFYPAEMNHQAVDAKAQKAGQAKPRDYHGAAYALKDKIGHGPLPDPAEIVKAQEDLALINELLPSLKERQLNAQLRQSLQKDKAENKGQPSSATLRLQALIRPLTLARINKFMTLPPEEIRTKFFILQESILASANGQDPTLSEREARAIINKIYPQLAQESGHLHNFKITNLLNEKNKNLRQKILKEQEKIDIYKSGTNYRRLFEEHPLTAREFKKIVVDFKQHSPTSDNIRQFLRDIDATYLHGPTSPATQNKVRKILQDWALEYRQAPPNTPRIGHLFFHYLDQDFLASPKFKEFVAANYHPSTLALDKSPDILQEKALNLIAIQNILFTTPAAYKKYLTEYVGPYLARPDLSQVAISNFLQMPDDPELAKIHQNFLEQLKNNPQHPHASLIQEIISRQGRSLPKNLAQNLVKLKLNELQLCPEDSNQELARCREVSSAFTTEEISAERIAEIFKDFHLSPEENRQIQELANRIMGQKESFERQGRSKEFVGSYLKFMLAQMIAAAVTGELHFDQIDAILSGENFIRFSAFALTAPALAKGLDGFFAITPQRPVRGLKGYRELLTKRGMLTQSASLAITMELVDLAMDAIHLPGEDFQAKAAELIDQHLSLGRAGEVGFSAAAFTLARPAAQAATDLVAAPLTALEKQSYQAFPKLAKLSNKLRRVVACSKLATASTPATFVTAEILEEALVFTAVELNQKLLRPIIDQQKFRQTEQDFWRYVESYPMEHSLQDAAKELSKILDNGYQQHLHFNARIKQNAYNFEVAKNNFNNVVQDYLGSMVSYARHTTPENLKSVTGRQVLALKDIQQEKLNLAEASRQDTLAQAGKTQIAEPLVQEVIAAYQQRPLLDEHLLNDPVFKQKRQKALDYLYAPTDDVNLIQAKDEALAQLKSAALKNKIGQFQNPQYNEAQNQAMREKLTELVDEYYGQPATLPALADLQQPLALPSNDQYRILREGILAQVQAEQASRDAFLTEVWQGVQQQKLNK